MRPHLPDYGVYLKWPESGMDWIHASDREIALELIPSPRVFRRISFEDGFYTLTYGKQVLRVRPSLWLIVHPEDLEVGDQVEVLARFGENEPAIGRVVEKLWDTQSNTIVYQVLSRDQLLPKFFTKIDLMRFTTRPQLRAPSFAHPVPTHRSIPDDLPPIPIEESALSNDEMCSGESEARRCD